MKPAGRFFIASQYVWYAAIQSVTKAACAVAMSICPSQTMLHISRSNRSQDQPNDEGRQASSK